jgi:hypothetical protein
MFKKLITTVVAVLFLASPVLAYNPNSFEDEETITVNGQRPKVDINVSELVVNISADDFVDGVAQTEVKISNDGTVPCHLALMVGHVPSDLDVTAEVDSNFLHKGETTSLNITVKLSEQQDAEDFTFTVLIEATLRP